MNPQVTDIPMGNGDGRTDEENTGMAAPTSIPNGGDNSAPVKRSTANLLRDAELVFDDMTFIAGNGKQQKVILKKVGAKVTNGHVLAIMGPSGAGKTTLISTLTKDANYGRAYGTVTLNGVEISHSVFTRYCYVVKQQDNNWPYLTTRETLMYAAELYNVADNKADVTSIVDGVIRKMGLVKVADTKSYLLSGGQQRRLSLAIGLLKQPTVLFLDEPTSGLDAASAAAIMEELTRLAKEEKLIIVCTIHQPSSKVYNDFDQVMILSRGQEAYVGKASDAVNYFDSIGYPLPAFTNAAEHFLDVVNADFSSQAEVDRVLEVWENQRRPQIVRRNSAISTSSFGRSKKSILISDETPPDHNFFNDLSVMFRRNIMLIRRDTILYLGRFIGFFIVNCIFGIVYIKARNYRQDQATNKLWVNAWYTGVPANMAVVAVYKLNLELRSVFREVKNGMGSTMAYIVSKTMLTLPIFFAFAISAMAVPAFVIQSFPIETSGWFILLWTAQIFVWESSSEVFASVFDNVVVGMLVHTAWWFGYLLFSGYLVPEMDLFWPLKVFYYITANNYYIRSACYLQFTNHDWEPCTDPTSSAVCVDSTDGIDVLGGLERVFPVVSTEDTYWGDLAALVGVGLVWKLIGIICILYKGQRESKLLDPIEDPLSDTERDPDETQQPPPQQQHQQQQQNGITINGVTPVQETVGSVMDDVQSSVLSLGDMSA